MRVRRINNEGNTFPENAGTLIATAETKEQSGEKRQMALYALTNSEFAIWVGEQEYRMEFGEVFQAVLNQEAFMKDLEKRAGGSKR